MERDHPSRAFSYLVVGPDGIRAADGIADKGMELREVIIHAVTGALLWPNAAMSHAGNSVRSPDYQLVQPLMSILSKTCDPEHAEKLERVLRYPGVLAKWRGRKVRIYSTQWSAYWRPNGAGYTTSEAEAGTYDFDDALSRTRHCGPEKGIQFYDYGLNTKSTGAERPV